MEILHWREDIFTKQVLKFCPFLFKYTSRGTLGDKDADKLVNSCFSLLKNVAEFAQPASLACRACNKEVFMKNKYKNSTKTHQSVAQKEAESLIKYLVCKKFACRDGSERNGLWNVQVKVAVKNSNVCRARLPSSSSFAGFSSCHSLVAFLAFPP